MSIFHEEIDFSLGRPLGPVVGRPVRSRQWRVRRMRRYVLRTTPRRITFSAADVASGVYTVALDRWRRAMEWQLAQASPHDGVTRMQGVGQVTDPSTGDVTVYCLGDEVQP